MNILHFRMFHLGLIPVHQKKKCETFSIFLFVFSSIWANNKSLLWFSLAIVDSWLSDLYRLLRGLFSLLAESVRILLYLINLPLVRKAPPLTIDAHRAVVSATGSGTESSTRVLRGKFQLMVRGTWQGGIKCGNRGTGFLDSEGSHR